MTASIVEIPGYLAGRWTLDPVHTYVGFVARHLMVSKVRGHFTRFEGEIVTAEDPAQSRVTVSVDPNSITTSNQMRDDHLRSADFFEVEKYPAMTYRSTGVRLDGDEIVLDGVLTIKEVTLPVPLKVEVNGFGPDTQGGTRVGLSATGELNRMDFGVSYNGPIPGGGVAISDKIQLAIEAEAILQAADGA